MTSCQRCFQGNLWKFVSTIPPPHSCVAPSVSTLSFQKKRDLALGTCRWRRHQENGYAQSWRQAQLHAASRPRFLFAGGRGEARSPRWRRCRNSPLALSGQMFENAGHHPTFLLGGRSAADILQVELFEAYGPVCITTEDASRGEKGFVTNHSVLSSERFDAIASCGPKPMMKAVAAFAAANNIDCEVSLENMMACGLGACLCCVEKDKEGHNVCVCKEGPVFNINQLQWLISK